MSMLKMHGGRIVQSLNAPFQANQQFRPCKLLSSIGAAKQLEHLGVVGADMAGYTSNIIPADGDIFISYAYCTGDETKMCISTVLESACGIWDLYINGGLDSAGYDDYAAVAAGSHRWITLTKKIIVGYNEIRMVVNGKNVASTNYYIEIGGISLQ